MPTRRSPRALSIYLRAFSRGPVCLRVYPAHILFPFDRPVAKLGPILLSRRYAFELALTKTKASKGAAVNREPGAFNRRRGDDIVPGRRCPHVGSFPTPIAKGYRRPCPSCEEGRCRHLSDRRRGVGAAEGGGQAEPGLPLALWDGRRVGRMRCELILVFSFCMCAALEQVLTVSWTGKNHGGSSRPGQDPLPG